MLRAPPGDPHTVEAERTHPESDSELDVDVLYWEDRVTWADLRQVTGIVFETWDQGRRPALDRHFVGIARIRAVLQEPVALDHEGRPAVPHPVPVDGGEVP